MRRRRPAYPRPDGSSSTSTTRSWTGDPSRRRERSSATSSFGYAVSNLRDYLVEKSAGTVSWESVVSLSLDLIRSGGPEAVSEVLSGVRGGAFVVVNALDGSDLDVVALAMARLTATGMSFGCRCAPAFVPSLVGLPPRRHPDGRRARLPAGPRAPRVGGRGLPRGDDDAPGAAAQARGHLTCVGARRDPGGVVAPRGAPGRGASRGCGRAGDVRRPALHEPGASPRQRPETPAWPSRERSARAVTDVVRGALTVRPASAHGQGRHHVSRRHVTQPQGMRPGADPRPADARDDLGLRAGRGAS